MTLAETGTRGLLGATVGSRTDRDEANLARRLLHLLRPGMLVLLDRAFAFGPRRPTRRELITAITTSQPPRDWTPRELARMLNVHPRHLATQLREWSLLGLFTRTGLGTHRLNTPAPPPSSTTEPDP